MPNDAPTLTPQEAIGIARLWGPGAHDVAHIRDGENSVWGFEAHGGRILRVTSEAHRTLDQLNAELAFVEHLVANGVNAAPPVESLSGGKVVDVSQIVGGEGAAYATVFNASQDAIS
jgi:Ser/Thr protein kinase RdoA (MazF antagonist)